VYDTDKGADCDIVAVTKGVLQGYQQALSGELRLDQFKPRRVQLPDASQIKQVAKRFHRVGKRAISHVVESHDEDGRSRQ
jgi:hypothetical protein